MKYTIRNHVNTIPTKFIIDKRGNNRFKLTGFDGTGEATVYELSLMIGLSKEAS